MTGCFLEGNTTQSFTAITLAKDQIWPAWLIRRDVFSSGNRSFMISMSASRVFKALKSIFRSSHVRYTRPSSRNFSSYSPCAPARFNQSSILHSLKSLPDMIMHSGICISSYARHDSGWRRLELEFLDQRVEAVSHEPVYQKAPSAARQFDRGHERPLSRRQCAHESNFVQTRTTPQTHDK